MQEILRIIVNDKKLHSHWLNTLSMMENAGAKKIKNCEHPVFVSEIILKHAAEESRHAYYLKKQIAKIEAGACPTYERKYLVAPHSSAHYLNALDVKICRMLTEEYGYKNERLKYAAYLLVTYAIEVRADLLYPEYQKALSEISSSVTVKSIIAEEETHLAEMMAQLKAFSPDYEILCKRSEAAEQELYDAWWSSVSKEIKASVLPS